MSDSGSNDKNQADASLWVTTWDKDGRPNCIPAESWAKMPESLKEICAPPSSIVKVFTATKMINYTPPSETMSLPPPFSLFAPVIDALENKNGIVGVRSGSSNFSSSGFTIKYYDAKTGAVLFSKPVTIFGL
jgi:hypothetical protein